MSDTPETDDLARGNHVVPAEWAEQLERERDEANSELNKKTIEYDKLFDEAEKIKKERDEAREVLQEIASASHFDNIGNWARNKARQALEELK